MRREAWDLIGTVSCPPRPLQASGLWKGWGLFMRMSDMEQDRVGGSRISAEPWLTHAHNCPSSLGRGGGAGCQAVLGMPLGSTPGSMAQSPKFIQVQVIGLETPGISLFLCCWGPALVKPTWATLRVTLLLVLWRWCWFLTRDLHFLGHGSPRPPST